MHVAITGSSGLIGSALRTSLEADGHQVLPVLRRDGGPGTTTWDPVAGTIDAAAFEGVDAVVNLAGESIGAKRWSEDQKRVLVESRTRGTALLATTLAGLAQPPTVLLSGSAIGFYGDRGDEQLTEASEGGAGFLPDLVRAWEAAAEPAAAAGIRVAHLRTGIVLDRREGALAKMLPLAKLGLLGKLGSGRQWMSWISLADEVRAIRFLLDHDVAGPVHLTAPTPVTNAAFTKAVGAAVRRPTVLPVPKFAPRLLLGKELADNLLFDGQRVLPTRLEEAGFEWEHETIEAALAAVLG